MGPGDIALAFWILSRPWRKARNGFRRRSFYFRAFFKVVSWFHHPDTECFESEHLLIRYLASQLNGPRTWSVASSKKLNAPWLGVLTANFMRVFGCGVDEALDQPYQRGLYLCAVNAEINGNVEFVSAHHEDVMAKLKAMHRG